MRGRVMPALAAGLLAAIGCAHAEEPMRGSFTARQACSALQSIRKQTNPGNVALTPDQTYTLLAGNKPNPTFYRIEVSGADPLQRWVPADCGEVKAGGAATGAPVSGTKPGGASYVFAVSWQPAFCEGLPDKVECRSQTPQRYDATHFTLHGLWPQPRGNAYCGVPQQDIEADRSHQWNRLPEPQLSPTTRQALEQAMPGTASFLDRHEWVEHGSCFFEKSADAYFRRAVGLIGQLNTSPVQKLFADNIGRQIDTDAIRQAFDQGFGPGAGERVRVACKRDGDRRIIVEMTIGLRGEVGDNASLATLIAAASPTDPGCKSGTVDAVGSQ